MRNDVATFRAFKLRYPCATWIDQRDYVQAPHRRGPQLSAQYKRCCTYILILFMCDDIFISDDYGTSVTQQFKEGFILQWALLGPV